MPYCITKLIVTAEYNILLEVFLLVLVKFSIEQFLARPSHIEVIAIYFAKKQQMRYQYRSCIVVKWLLTESNYTQA